MKHATQHYTLWHFQLNVHFLAIHIDSESYILHFQLNVHFLAIHIDSESYILSIHLNVALTTKGLQERKH